MFDYTMFAKKVNEKESGRKITVVGIWGDVVC